MNSVTGNILDWDVKEIFTTFPPQQQQQEEEEEEEEEEEQQQLFPVLDLLIAGKN